jgi:spermidine/putrescine transport system ATP-binding protein
MFDNGFLLLYRSMEEAKEVVLLRIVELVGVVKNFGRTVVLDHVDLYIKQNEFLTLLGPSGCGKTTTLRIIGGFEHPTGGDLLFKGKSILSVPPYKR